MKPSASDKTPAETNEDGEVDKKGSDSDSENKTLVFQIKLEHP